jgi:hypothetical protein
MHRPYPALSLRSGQRSCRLIAGKLNLNCASSDSSCIASAIAEDAWLCQQPVGSNVKANSAPRAQIASAHSALDSYNEGTLCARHCPGS